MISLSALRASQANRLADGGRIDRERPLFFEFDGRQLMGYRGDTLASALLANGIDVVGRSFKYARPRGIMTAGVEEPNAILQVGRHADTEVPNVRATEQPLYDGLVCRPVNGWPSADNDLMGVLGRVGGALMTPGFYYKTFMWPKSRWETYEHFIRRAAGLGRAPRGVDPDHYEHRHHHVDVLVVGAGPTGLMAALTAARAGQRVLLADEQTEAGGSLLYASERIDGQPAMAWVQTVVNTLAGLDDVEHLQCSTVTGLHDHGFLTISERVDARRGGAERPTPGSIRHRLHKVRAGRVVLATGAHERPLVFANNDRPGCFTAASISHYIQRYAVVPGRRLVLMTTNDGAYQCAFDWQDAGREVVAIVDTRAQPDGAATDAARERGLRVLTGSAVIEARGRRRVDGATIAPLAASARHLVGDSQHVACDTIASSGGWSPAVHLSCHTGDRPVWDEEVLGFVPGPTDDPRVSGGSLIGHHELSDCLADGIRCGQAAVRPSELGASDETGSAAAADLPDPVTALPTVSGANEHRAPAMALFLVPHARPSSRAPKQFVDFQNDVTADGIQMTVREGFESIEHVKRYTAMGFGTDQGKTGNINGMAIVAQALDRSIAETGTTVFRPNYTPVSFGVVAGAHVNELFDPKRFTALHKQHLALGAEFENVGQWKRPWYYPHTGESIDEAIRREQLAVREAVGILDASTLGKIDIQGPDAREFLARVYTNAWARLAPGACRYGLMCGEDGMVMDDGVTACITDEHFHMTTTTGGAASVLSWLELWHQTEWSDLEVYFTSVTDHWATLSIAGPRSRELLSTLTDLELDAEHFGFMQWREADVAGVPARVFRISFTGELSFEINVPAHFASSVWDALFEQGERFGLTPYGTETMHVLRAEKGFIIVGQDTDGSVTPHDLDMGWAVAANKPFAFLGQRGMQRADCLRDGRKQLVGLLATDRRAVIPEGAQAVDDPHQSIPMRMVGHVTSSYYSAALERGIALGLIRNGLSRKGELVWFPLADGRLVEASIVDPVFVDPDGSRQRS